MTDANRDALSIRVISVREASDVLAQSRAHQESLYPSESIHQVSAETLATSPNVVLGCFGASAPDTAVGCVGLLLEGQDPGTAEVKSLFVTPGRRRQGVGSTLMGALEERARESGIRVVRLETGIYQPESVRLYQACGYSVIPRFGDYHDDPLSVFMEKVLA